MTGYAALAVFGTAVVAFYAGHLWARHHQSSYNYHEMIRARTFINQMEYAAEDQAGALIGNFAWTYLRRVRDFHHRSETDDQQPVLDRPGHRPHQGETPV